MVFVDQDYIDEKFNKVFKRFDQIERRLHALAQQTKYVDANGRVSLDLLSEQSKRDKEEITEEVDTILNLLAEQENEQVQSPNGHTSN